MSNSTVKRKDEGHEEANFFIILLFVFSSVTYSAIDPKLLLVFGFLKKVRVMKWTERPAGEPNPGAAPVTFGTWNGGSRFIGRIDEVAIFNAALEEDDIMRIATDGLKEALSAGASVESLNKLPVTWGRMKE